MIGVFFTNFPSWSLQKNVISISKIHFLRTNLMGPLKKIKLVAFSRSVSGFFYAFSYCVLSLTTVLLV